MVHAPCGARLKTPAACERSCNVRAPPLTLGSLWQKIFATKFQHTGFFFLPLHALTCRHPCQRGGARGSHARVDLGDLLTARMSGAGCAGRSIIQQPPLGRRPSPLPQLQPQPRANLQTVPSGACVQHLLARIVGCSVAHQRARPPCARQHIAWSRRWGMRLGLWLWLGLRMRRRCGDGGGGAAVGCRRLPSATRPAAERPAELCASGIPSLLTVMAVSARNFCVKFKMVFRGLPRPAGFCFFLKIAI